MAFFGLKLGLDLEMRAAHPHQKFQGVPPTSPPPGGVIAQNILENYWREHSERESRRSCSLSLDGNTLTFDHKIWRKQRKFTF